MYIVCLGFLRVNFHIFRKQKIVSGHGFYSVIWACIRMMTRARVSAVEDSDMIVQ